ncbi:MAG: Serine/threonine-protein kinase PrkC [Planctomycetota bacterium]
MADNSNLVGGFELKNCIASGSSTQIWEVVEQGATVPFAMKLLLPDSLKDAEAKAVLKHEFKVGQSLDHPGFVRFHRQEFTRDHGFFIMDYFRAPSLKVQLSANLPEAQSRMKKIVESICQAYVYLHEKGWLHRDIKPDNVLVNKAGEVRVIDFSLACRNATGVMKLLAGKQKSIMGTRTYIAPEIILRRPPTPQSDIYSLAVTLYEIATGAPPFAGLSPNDLLKKHLGEEPAPPSNVNRNVSPELDMMLLRMLKKKPKDRPKEMREVMSLFRNCKFFLEDPVELHERKVREAKANESLSVDKRLDSRADADRVSRGLAAPVKPKKAGRTTAPIGELAPPKKQGAPPAAAQATAQPAPQMPFGMPGMMPGMMYPQPMMPPMMPPPMMAPPMMPPMMPGMAAPMMMPGMAPGMMPGMVPGMMAPAPQIPAPVASQQPAPVPSPAPPVPSPAPVVQQSVAVPQPAPAADAQGGQKTVLLPLERRSAAAAKPAEEHTEMEFMTELPDIA